MRSKHSDLAQIKELDYLGSEACTGALSAHLLARIARRPGRWRQRMQSRAHERELELYDEYYNDAA